MKSLDKKFIFFSIKLIGLLCIASIFALSAPHYAHHILLAITISLLLLGASFLLKYKSQINWIEGKAVLKNIKECEEEVAISQYSKLKYYYPVIEYEYFANGATHFGTNVSFEKENIWVPEINDWGDLAPEKKRWWLSLKPGDNHPVYVNPHNENEAVLIKDLTKTRRSHHLAFLGGGVLIGLVWILVVFVTLK